MEENVKQHFWHIILYYSKKGTNTTEMQKNLCSVWRRYCDWSTSSKVICLNISSDTIKVLEENTGRKISDIPRSNIFTNMSPRARDIKERINKWDFIKIKSFSIAKENSSKMKREPTVWENIFANDTSDKGLISKIYKELTRLHSRKTNNPINKWAKDLNTHFSKEDIRGPRDIWKDAQHH